MLKKQREGRARISDGGIGWGSRLSSNAIPIIVVLVVLVLVVALVWSSSLRRLQAWTAPGDVLMAVPTAEPRALSPIPNPAVLRVTLQDAVEALEQGRAVLVDVRSRSSYDKAHATGALSFPENEVVARLDELPADQALILY